MPWVQRHTVLWRPRGIYAFPLASTNQLWPNSTLCNVVHCSAKNKCSSAFFCQNSVLWCISKPKFSTIKDLLSLELSTLCIKKLYIKYAECNAHNLWNQLFWVQSLPLLSTLASTLYITHFQVFQY